MNYYPHGTALHDELTNGSTCICQDLLTRYLCSGIDLIFYEQHILLVKASLKLNTNENVYSYHGQGDFTIHPFRIQNINCSKL